MFLRHTQAYCLALHSPTSNRRRKRNNPIPLRVLPAPRWLLCFPLHLHTILSFQNGFQGYFPPNSTNRLLNCILLRLLLGVNSSVIFPFGFCKMSSINSSNSQIQFHPKSSILASLSSWLVTVISSTSDPILSIRAAYNLNRTILGVLRPSGHPIPLPDSLGTRLVAPFSEDFASALASVVTSQMRSHAQRARHHGPVAEESGEEKNTQSGALIPFGELSFY
eukprot:GABV01000576.1.p2 GENE.GABV01000576.1~~GABV01000576.1.p2  ORF type:complete len:222 (+),score=47.89 GABV01000576.1:391-1056(+)